ncbi:MAG TPA: urea transporter [Chitinophagales bacterium]|nr:urea transporter [Chitinophagales bacterium]
MTIKPINNLKLFSIASLNGVSQIMLQENSVTGVFFLVGIAISSLNMALAALLATIVGTATAYLFKYNFEEIQKGLYGFSAALVGVAIVLFFKLTVATWLLVIVGAAIATIIQHFFIKRNITAFTLPFVLVTWLFYYAASFLHPTLLASQFPLIPSENDIYFFYIKGYGQVIFQANIWSGVLFLLGVFFHSRIAAIYGLAGAAIAGLAVLPLASSDAVANGLLSYNAVLCAIVFAGVKFKNCLWAFISVVLSLVIILLLQNLNILALTFPFVAASFLTLKIKNRNQASPL